MSTIWNQPWCSLLFYSFTLSLSRLLSRRNTFLLLWSLSFKSLWFLSTPLYHCVTLFWSNHYFVRKLLSFWSHFIFSVTRTHPSPALHITISLPHLDLSPQYTFTSFIFKPDLSPSTPPGNIYPLVVFESISISISLVKEGSEPLITLASPRKMPIKWTPENNELVSAIDNYPVYSNTTNWRLQLLLKILETHDIKVDTALVAAAWRK